ncbi:MAG: DsbA family oxidoreductase [Nitrospira sp.]|jgi:predicted DsbA family dithiol-disulfide isomerase|nr:DsbA family oxidoreductase [Nitrospira sp.]MDH4245870.1 DsbA family oxidoreductase [Nitrospira sp.]MDH4356873.1 DsbA family oxidoreductase [Nitrospira sp.]MDH5320070.1 DsbA family oxidoreductase [Nitrospira sp.]
MNGRTLQIEVYSDVICPWCYVGKRRLERALQQLDGGLKAEIHWRPFQLNPTMPQQGMDRRVYLETKFGSLRVFEEMEQHLLEAGKTEQIPFAFGKIVRTPNTFQAHRLIWYAGQQGHQDAIVNELFKGYFEEGFDIGSASVLTELADRAGLKAATFLESDDGCAEVKAEEVVGHKLGIRAVPYFVLDNAYGISGAQPVEVFVAAIEKVRPHRSSTAGSS